MLINLVWIFGVWVQDTMPEHKKAGFEVVENVSKNRCNKKGGVLVKDVNTKKYFCSILRYPKD